MLLDAPQPLQSMHASVPLASGLVGVGVGMEGAGMSLMEGQGRLDADADTEMELELDGEMEIVPPTQERAVDPDTGMELKRPPGWVVVGSGGGESEGFGTGIGDRSGNEMTVNGSEEEEEEGEWSLLVSFSFSFLGMLSFLGLRSSFFVGHSGDFFFFSDLAVL